MWLFNKKKKYDINPKENIGQVVYGIPDALRKQWDEQDKRENGTKLFDAYEGGYFGNSYYYYIDCIDNIYEFRFGYSKDGAYIANSIHDPNINITKQSADYYQQFIDELTAEIKDWNETYVNTEIMDGTQWHIKFLDKNIEYGGSNAFPENYEAAMNILKKYFEVDKHITNSTKYDVKPEDNVPREVYGIPNPFSKTIKKCPYCGSSEVLEYLYGEPAYDYDKSKYVLGGCIVTGNDPAYKCMKCGKDIYREKSESNFELDK